MLTTTSKRSVSIHKGKTKVQRLIPSKGDYFRRRSVGSTLPTADSWRKNLPQGVPLLSAGESVGEVDA